MVSQAVSATNGQAQREEHWPSLQEMNDRRPPGPDCQVWSGQENQRQTRKREIKVLSSFQFYCGHIFIFVFKNSMPVIT